MNVNIPKTGWRVFAAIAWSWSIHGKRVIQIGIEPRNEDDYWMMLSVSFGRWFGFGFVETWHDGPWSWLDIGLIHIFFGGRSLPAWTKRFAKETP